MRLFTKWFTSLFFNALALFAVSKLFDGFYLAGFETALFASFILSLLNIIVKPILVVLTLPVTVLSLGLFLFVINAVTLMLAQYFIGATFDISHFGVAIIAAIIISIINTILGKLVDKD